MNQLNNLAKQAYNSACKRGIFDKELSINDLLMAIVEEVGEVRKSKVLRLPNNFIECINDEKVNLPFRKQFESYIKDSTQAEFADILIATLAIMHHLKIDVDLFVELGLRYNSLRSK